MTDDRIIELCGQISANFAHPWTVKEMAETVNISKSHFQKLFKSVTNNTPIAFLQEKRLEKARELLEGKHRQICDIARQVGIPHESRFTHDFKKKFGKTPSAYRKDFWEKKHEKTVFG